MANSWASTPTKAVELSRLWRKRVGVEPTTLAAKDRINGFEGHEDHRTPFASVIWKTLTLGRLLNPRNIVPRRIWLRCYCGAIGPFDSSHGFMQVRDSQMCVALCHRETFVSQQFSDIPERHSALLQPRRERLAIVVPFIIADPSGSDS